MSKIKSIEEQNEKTLKALKKIFDDIINEVISLETLDVDNFVPTAQKIIKQMPSYNKGDRQLSSLKGKITRQWSKVKEILKAHFHAQGKIIAAIVKEEEEKIQRELSIVRRKSDSISARNIEKASAQLKQRHKTRKNPKSTIEISVLQRIISMPSSEVISSIQDGGVVENNRAIVIQYIKKRAGELLYEEIEKTAKGIGRKAVSIAKSKIVKEVSNFTGNPYRFYSTSKRKQKQLIQSASQRIISAISSSVKIERGENAEKDYINVSIGVGNIRKLENAGWAEIQYSGEKVPLWMILEFGTLKKFLLEGPGDESFDFNEAPLPVSTLDMFVKEGEGNIYKFNFSNRIYPGPQVRKRKTTLSKEITHRISRRKKETEFYPMYFPVYDKNATPNSKGHKIGKWFRAFIHEDELEFYLKYGKVDMSYEGFQGYHYLSASNTYLKAQMLNAINRAVKKVEKIIKHEIETTNLREILDIPPKKQRNRRQTGASFAFVNESELNQGR